MPNQYLKQSPLLLDRFMAKVSPEPNSGCWLWTGSIQQSPFPKYPGYNGYGSFARPGKSKLAHRASYELFVGEIPDGLHIDHLCRVRSCVNPKHLEPVTRAENVRRGNGGAYFRDKTHCPQGHEYSSENTTVKPISGKPNRFNRICRTCAIEYGHRKRQAQREAGLFHARPGRPSPEAQAAVAEALRCWRLSKQPSFDLDQDLSSLLTPKLSE